MQGIPLDEISMLAGRVAARVHPRWCSQHTRSDCHIIWSVMSVDSWSWDRRWMPIGSASMEYLEFVLYQREKERHRSIANLVDRLSTFMEANIYGIPD